MHNDKIFVYGSLMEGLFNYNIYLLGHCKSIEEGYTYGKLYHLPYKGYPALLEGNDKVYGQIITLSNSNHILPKLDALERYTNSNDDEYQRKYRNVYTITGDCYTVYTYMYQVHNDSKFDKEAMYVEKGNWKQFQSQVND